jgi:hypothetical protein
MRVRVLASLGALIVTLLLPVLAAAQASTGGASRWTPTRTPDGQPDIQGVWNNGSYVPMQRAPELKDKPLFTEQEALEYYKKMAEAEAGRDPKIHYNRTTYGLDKWQNGIKPELRTSVVTDPPDGRIPPLTPEARKRVAALNKERIDHADDVHYRGLYERCIKGYWGLPMLKQPSEAGDGTGADGEQQILQLPGYVVILAQSNNDIRIIPVDGSPHPSDTITTLFGDSRGRWEGETLVIDTKNFNDLNSFQGSTKALHLVERFTRIDADTLRYQFTIDDPNTWTRPWSGEVDWHPSPGPIYEAACHEANYGLVNVLRGARADRASQGRK